MVLNINADDDNSATITFEDGKIITIRNWGEKPDHPGRWLGEGIDQDGQRYSVHWLYTTSDDGEAEIRLSCLHI